MLTFIIIATLIYLLKMLVDYTHEKFGMVSVSGVRGFLIGFDVEEQVVDYQHPETKEDRQAVQVSVEIALFFVTILFMWQQELEPENYDEDDF